MPIDTNTFIEYANDPRYDILKKPIKVDKDSKAYEIQLIPPQTASQQFSGSTTVTQHDTVTSTVSVPSTTCYNSSGQLHRIEVSTGADFKANFAGSYVYMKYKCGEARTAVGGTEQAPTYTSYFGRMHIPDDDGTGQGGSVSWNTLNLFSTVSLKVNQSQTPLEQYLNVGHLGHITTDRYLKKYKKDALERHDDALFTPCIETKLDTTSFLSIESAKRTIAWLTDGDTSTNGASKAENNNTNWSSAPEFVKMIPLSDIFECAEIPGIFSNVNKIVFEFTLKLPDAIGFCTAGTDKSFSKPYVFVTDIALMFDSVRMQPFQTSEIAAEKMSGSVENVGFIEGFVAPVNYTPNSQMVVTSQKDVQSVTVLFPATGYAQTNINPLQYVPASLKSMSVMYGPDMPMRNPLKLGGTNSGLNTQAYALFKKACGADRCNIVSPSISFAEFAINYSIYTVPIFNPILPHRNANPLDVRIDSNSDSNQTMSVIVLLRKFAGMQIQADGSVERL